MTVLRLTFLRMQMAYREAHARAPIAGFAISVGIAVAVGGAVRLPLIASVLIGIYFGIRSNRRFRPGSPSYDEVRRRQEDRIARLTGRRPSD